MHISQILLGTFQRFCLLGAHRTPLTLWLKLNFQVQLCKLSLRHWSTPTPVYRAAAHPWLLCVAPHSRAPLQVAARIPCILLGFVKLLRRGERLPLPWKGGEQNRTIVYHNKCFNLFEGKCMRLSMPFIYLYALLICRIYIFMF